MADLSREELLDELADMEEQVPFLRMRCAEARVDLSEQITRTVSVYGTADPYAWPSDSFHHVQQMEDATSALEVRLSEAVAYRSELWEQVGVCPHCSAVLGDGDADTTEMVGERVCAACAVSIVRDFHGRGNCDSPCPVCDPAEVLEEIDRVWCEEYEADPAGAFSRMVDLFDGLDMSLRTVNAPRYDICPLHLQHVEICADDADEDCAEWWSPERCKDCDRPIVWDESRKDYRHLADPATGCFLIRAEPIDRAARAGIDEQNAWILITEDGSEWGLFSDDERREIAATATTRIDWREDDNLGGWTPEGRDEYLKVI